jgi:Integrase core domain
VNGFMYFLVIDAYSNWPEIFKMTSTTAPITIDRLEEAFSRQGLCDTIVSDNGPQFTAGEFEKFCTENGIAHIKTAPFHPQSNGQAERLVGVLKTGLKKLEGEGNTDHILRKFLMCYRYTPSYALGDKSPFELMTGRVMKTKLDLLQPPANHGDIRDEKMESQFNSHHGAKWREFEVGEKVYAKVFSNNAWKWIPGTVLERCGNVNYFVLVKVPSGERQIKSHANQLKRRYNVIDFGENPFADSFDIAPPREIEPQIIPVPETEDEDEFQDAEEGEIEVPEPIQAPVLAPVPAPASAAVPASPRRSNRARIPTNRLNYN